MGCTLSAEDSEKDGLGLGGYDAGAQAAGQAAGKYPIPADWDSGDWIDWGCTDQHFLIAWRHLDTAEMVFRCTGSKERGSKLDPDGTDGGGKIQSALESAIDMALTKTNVQIQKSLGIKTQDIKPNEDLVVKMIQALLTAGISPDIASETSGGMTPLMKLCSTPLHSKVVADVLKVRLKIARLLLEHKAKVDETDDGGHTALHYLCTTRSTSLPGKQYSQIEEPLMKLLIDSKADIDRESDQHGFTPLMYAVMVDNGATDPLQLERVKCLIKYGADVNIQAKGGGGTTALILAALKAKVSGYSAFDDESPITGTKTAPDLEVISFLARECKAELKTDAAVNIGEFRPSFPWVQDIEEPQVVALLGLTTEQRQKLWDGANEEKAANYKWN